MLDSLLIVEGEPLRSFEFTLDFQQSFPSRAAAEVSSPVVEFTTSDVVPRAAHSGWILGITAKNVQLARARPVSEAGSEPRIQLLMAETEGRKASCRIHTARAVKSARVVTTAGQILEEVAVNKGVAELPFGRYQIKLVELTLG